MTTHSIVLITLQYVSCGWFMPQCLEISTTKPSQMRHLLTFKAHETADGKPGGKGTVIMCDWVVVWSALREVLVHGAGCPGAHTNHSPRNSGKEAAGF